MSAPVFGVFFVGRSYPIADSNFVRNDATHWLLDVGATVTREYAELKEVSLFLAQPNVLPPGQALGLYISVSGEWQWRGFVSNDHPSEVMPLQWPEISGGSLTGTNHPAVQLGVSLEPLEEVVQREGTKLASRQEFAKRVALDLFRFMESFNKGVQGDTLILPTNCLELWFQKFDSKFRRNPEFLMTSGEKAP
ncbi:g1234 [Coccomyxa viridis]|uniref:G1234 protein n=1 Tax=Coccomyxa viridis TaxID=1274662 RepID=A0ABP1FHN2_9CHLO